MACIRRTHPEAAAARPLLEALADEYERTYGERTAGELASREVDDFLPPRGAMLLVVEDGETIAGGALAPLSGEVAEIKRMWTAPGHRGRGLARAVLISLEREALRLGYCAVRLQTGAYQMPAIRLYRSAGYHPAAPFGRYRQEPLARGFAKPLRGARGPVA